MSITHSHASILLPGKLNRNIWLLAGLINETIDTVGCRFWKGHRDILNKEGGDRGVEGKNTFKLLKNVIHRKQQRVLSGEVERKPWGGRGFLSGSEQFIPHSHVETIYSHLGGTGNILKLIMFLPPFSLLLSCLQSKVRACLASPVTGQAPCQTQRLWKEEEWSEISFVVCDSL